MLISFTKLELIFVICVNGPSKSELIKLCNDFYSYHVTCVNHRPLEYRKNYTACQEGGHKFVKINVI